MFTKTTLIFTEDPKQNREKQPKSTKIYPSLPFFSLTGVVAPLAGGDTLLYLLLDFAVRGVEAIVGVRWSIFSVSGDYRKQQ